MKYRERSPEMQCERCKCEIEEGEEREHYGQTLCEDCYMDALSPSKACDPWAVHRARTFKSEEGSELNETQTKVLEILKETGGAEPGYIIQKLKIKPADLQREIAPLRHLELIRGEMRDGKRIIRLW